MNHYISESELLAGIENIRNSLPDSGVVEMIVIRPAESQRKVMQEVQVSAEVGVHGDYWAEMTRGEQPDGCFNPDDQVAIMNSRCIALLAVEKERWSLAGDQLYVDMDLSVENLPVGQRLSVGTAILEITPVPHTGCALFTERFGKEAVRFVNSPVGKQLRLRGVYARVVRDGIIKTGDLVKKVTA